MDIINLFDMWHWLVLLGCISLLCRCGLLLQTQ